MKKIISLLGVIVLYLNITPSIAQSFTPPFVSHTPVFDVTNRNLRQIILDDGVYELVVECSSSSGSNARYILDVRIQNDEVTHIYFDNGGSLHRGWNNSEYTWRGGGIRWSSDYYGNITDGIAIIQVTYQGGRWQLFKVII